MTNRFTRRLTYGKRMLLASAAVLVIAAPIVAGLLNPPRGRAQAPYGGAGGPGLAFDAASVKATPPPDQIGPSRMQGAGRPGQFTSTNMPLRNLIWLAYSVPADQQDAVSGLPPDSARYDIVAKRSSRNNPRSICNDASEPVGGPLPLGRPLETDRGKGLRLGCCQGRVQAAQGGFPPGQHGGGSSAQVSAPGSSGLPTRMDGPCIPRVYPRIGPCRQAGN